MCCVTSFGFHKAVLRGRGAASNFDRQVDSFGSLSASRGPFSQLLAKAHRCTSLKSRRKLTILDITKARKSTLNPGSKHKGPGVNFPVGVSRPRVARIFSLHARNTTCPAEQIWLNCQKRHQTLALLDRCICTVIIILPRMTGNCFFAERLETSVH